MWGRGSREDRENDALITSYSRTRDWYSTGGGIGADFMGAVARLPPQIVYLDII